MSDYVKIVTELEGQEVARWATPSEEWFKFDWYHAIDPKRFGTYFVTGHSKLKSDSQEVSQNPTLFIEFAETPLTAQGISGFARKWGLLDDPRSTELFSVFHEDGKHFWRISAEPLYKWVQSIYRMRREWDLWQMVQRRDEAGLAKWVKWRGKSLVRCGAYVVAALDENKERLEYLQPGDVFEPACLYIQDGFNKPELWPVMPRLSPILNWDEHHEWQTQIVPSNLMGALWLQFTTAICGESSFLQCHACGKWLQIVPGGGRPDKRYCSDACRMRAYRKRKAQGSKPRKKNRKNRNGHPNR